MRRAIFLFVVLALLTGCLPSLSNPCIDDYYEVFDDTADRDAAADAYWTCVGEKR
ncbi:MAG: hypothetical protein AAF267_01435 [Deinococcota bacterium]